MSTFSAPSKPDAFQPIKAESAERPRCWKVCRTIEKTDPTMAQVSQWRVLDIMLNLEQHLFVYDFKISTRLPQSFLNFARNGEKLSMN